MKSTTWVQILDDADSLGTNVLGLDAGDFCLFKGFSINDEATLVDVDDGALSALEEPISDPQLWTV